MREDFDHIRARFGALASQTSHEVMSRLGRSDSFASVRPVDELEAFRSKPTPQEGDRTAERQNRPQDHREVAQPVRHEADQLCDGCHENRNDQSGTVAAHREKCRDDRQNAQGAHHVPEYRFLRAQLVLGIRSFGVGNKPSSTFLHPYHLPREKTTESPSPR